MSARKRGVALLLVDFINPLEFPGAEGASLAHMRRTLGATTRSSRARASGWLA